MQQRALDKLREAQRAAPRISLQLRLLQLITIRQFPPADKSLPPLGKSKWWIPTATKVSL